MDGRNLNDLLDIYNLANLINSPTRIDKTSETLLDIILTNSKAKVLTSGVIDVQISDHSLVYTILRSSAPRTRSRKIVTRVYKTFKRDEFLTDLQSIPFSVMDIFDDVNDKLFVFESLYMDVVNEHAPLKRVHLRGNQVPFMTKQWRQEIRYRNRLWKKYLKERTDENYCKYKAQRNVCTRLRRKAIKDFFRKKNVENSSREFWNVYRPFLHSKSKQANDIFIKENDVVINQKKDIAEIFNNYFVNIADDLVDKSLQHDYAADFNDHPSVQSVINTTKEGIFTLNFSLKCINELEICQILANINTRKSCGHDFLHPRIVKESAAVIAQPLACIFNESIKQCKYPTVWKMGQVTPSFKKGNELDKTNYRPLTVLPVLNNVFERIIASQMEEFYTEILPDYTSAYRKQFSCETALLRLVEDWKSSRDKKELVAVVSIDLSKAFDTIPHDLLLAKLKAYGMTKECCSFFQSYLRNRMQRVKIGDTFSEWTMVKRGVPQGSVLGPMFYNIFSSDLFHCIPSGKLHSYADDCQIYDSHMEPNELDKLIQNYVTSVNQWFRINGMISNPSKHQAMVLGNKLHHRFSFPIKDSLELFGMTIDQDLNIDKHIINICKEVNDQFNVMKRFSNLVSKHTMLLLYRNFIVPRFNYCADIWHFCGARNTKKLEDLNKRILRFILNEHNLSYSELLETISQVSLYNKRLASMLTTCYKCIHYERYPQYLKQILNRRSGYYSLRGTDIIDLPKVMTTKYGLHSFRYELKQLNVGTVSQIAAGFKILCENLLSQYLT